MKSLFLILFSFILFSCSKEQYNNYLIRPASCDSIAFSFEKDIRPIFNGYCNMDECHAPGGEGSYDYTSYAVVADRIRAGTLEYRLDLSSDEQLHMPKNMLLSKCDYYIIKTWIRQGYPEN